MPRPNKKTELKAGEKVITWPKTPVDWMGMFNGFEKTHWREFLVTIKIGKIMAGKPSSLDVAKAMIEAHEKKAGKPSGIVAEVMIDPNYKPGEGEEQEESPSICEFHRRPDKEGIWLPANNVKAMLKENWKVLGFYKEVPGSGAKLPEALFVFGEHEKDWLYLGDKPNGIDSGPAHTMTPQGKKNSIKVQEYAENVTVSFRILIARRCEEWIPPSSLAQTLFHAQTHALGASRSQGKGMFTIVDMKETEASAAMSAKLEEEASAARAKARAEKAAEEGNAPAN